MSRFDPWKDPIGVIEAYRIVKEEFPTLQLVLAGSMATDDPEGFHYWELANEARAGDADVHLLSNIQQVGNVQINAFQRAADVVMQKSLREGFGLTVSEGLWKGRPVIGGRCGGITLQIEEGVNGYLVDDVETAAKRTADLFARSRARGRRWARAGREHVRKQVPVDPRARGLAPTVHRGCDDRRLAPRPVSVRPQPDGTISAHAARAASSARWARCWTEKLDDDVTWIAAAMSDDDRAAVHAGATQGLDIGLRLLDLDPAQHRMHYDVVANGVLWFLHHGMFDRVRRPRFDLRFREAWNAFVAVNERFADAIAETAPRARRSCSCRTTS